MSFEGVIDGNTSTKLFCGGQGVNRRNMQNSILFFTMGAATSDSSPSGMGTANLASQR